MTDNSSEMLTSYSMEKIRLSALTPIDIIFMWIDNMY